MPKKVGNVIFRKIGGRLVPIRIKNLKDPASGYSSPLTKERKIVAEGPKGEFMGQLSLSVPKKGRTADVVDVRVPKEFRRKGISRALFKKAGQFSGRIGKKFLRGTDIQNPAQIKIRRGFGKSVFTADQFPPFGEGVKKVGSNKAISFLKNNTTGRQIKATTMIPKKYRRKR